MDAAGRGLVGDGAGDVARCGVVLVGPAGGDVEPCWDVWAQLLVGAAFRHLCAVAGGRPPGSVALLAWVGRPAAVLVADFGASPDAGVRGAGVVLARLMASERTWSGVAARAAALLARVRRGDA